MGLSRTVSEINDDFSPKSQNFPTRVFCAPAEGVPLGIGYTSARSQKNWNDGIPGREKKFDNISRLDTIHERD